MFPLQSSMPLILYGFLSSLVPSSSCTLNPNVQFSEIPRSSPTNSLGISCAWIFSFLVFCSFLRCLNSFISFVHPFYWSLPV
jgi:hypothetical protein